VPIRRSTKVSRSDTFRHRRRLFTQWNSANAPDDDADAPLIAAGTGATTIDTLLRLIHRSMPIVAEPAEVARRLPERQSMLDIETVKTPSMLPPVKAKLLEGKKGLIVGIANENSIAWGCAKAFRAFGAEVAVTYLNEKAKKFVAPLARELQAPILLPLDTNVPGQMEAVFAAIASEWGKLDFVVHSIAFSPKEALQGRVVDVTQQGFLATLDVSCWSFIRMAHLAEPLMRKDGGTLFTMTYYGSQTVVKNYNIMGVAKAALEAAVRYIAAELGPKGIRVHAISPGPLATRAASGIPEFDELLDKAKSKAPARSLVSIDDVGVATAFLAHDAARLITGDTLYVDGGYHIID
jgi:enoyl-[acyl-carrier protein] reductase I